MDAQSSLFLSESGSVMNLMLARMYEVLAALIVHTHLSTLDAYTSDSKPSDSRDVSFVTCSSERLPEPQNVNVASGKTNSLVQRQACLKREPTP